MKECLRDSEEPLPVQNDVVDGLSSPCFVRLSEMQGLRVFISWTGQSPR